MGYYGIKHPTGDELKKPPKLRKIQQVVLVINGLDRLIMELKLPPTDAYHKRRGRREGLKGERDRLGEKSLRCLPGGGLLTRLNFPSFRIIDDVCLVAV